MRREAPAGGPEPDQTRSFTEGRVEAKQVRAVFGRSGLISQSTGESGVATAPGAGTADQTVNPSGVPTVGSSGNNCTPGVEVLNWAPVRDGSNWRANVTSMVVSGTVNVQAWPSSPSSMTVPNTANPVDGGNINNTSGSSNHWQAAIDDMADYDNASGGGAGANWHATAASSAHEWHHWNTDYLVSSIGAGNWTQANRDIDALTVPVSGHGDAAKARTALGPRVTRRFNTFVSAVTRHWNNDIAAKDRPGLGGGGYAAGMGVLNRLIGRVRAYAGTKSWTGGGSGGGSGSGSGGATTGDTGGGSGSD